MTEDESREIVVAPSTELTGASRLAERTLAARAARTALSTIGVPALELAIVGGRTLVVGPDGAGMYLTISSAVADARDGDRILVRPGTYRESVLVSRSIEIIGDGDSASVVVLSGAGPCFHLNGSAKALRNLTLHGGGFLDYWIPATRREAALVVSEGSPVVEDLLVRESHGIVVEGDDASPTVRRNVLLKGHGVGIWARWGAKGTIEENDIAGNELAGIMLAGEGTNPLVRANRIHDGAENYDGYGIYVCAGAAGTVDGNTVFGMFGGGIVVDGPGTSPMIRGNQVTRNRVDGIMSRRGATPTLLDNITS